MKRSQKGSTPKQYAYAQLKMTGGGRSKNEMARKVGFSPSVANNVKYKIESTEGYHNAMLDLAQKSNNVLGSILAEYEARGLSEFSNKDLNGAVSAIGAAWDRIETRRAPAQQKDPEKNPLRKMVIEKSEKITTTVTIQETKDDKDAVDDIKEESVRDIEVVHENDETDLGTIINEKEVVDDPDDF